MARPLSFRWQNRVRKQVGVTVDESGQKGGFAQIDDLHARGGLHFRRRANFLDLVSFNQNDSRGEHVACPRIEQAGGFDQHRRRRLRLLSASRARRRGRDTDKNCKGHPISQLVHTDESPLLICTTTLCGSYTTWRVYMTSRRTNRS